MTNYSERVDEILHQFFVNAPQYDDDISVKEAAAAKASAKQALTSLIKELVAEAKPLLKERTASTEFTTWDGKTKVVKTFESETDSGFNKAINEFEQNLLKALEEV